MNLLDTIAAISTPYGKGGIAVIRISGQDAISVVERVFVSKSGAPLSDIASNRATYGAIYSHRNDRTEHIDDGIAVIFRAPHSFTGEDTVEISCHGGILITQRVLEAALCAGARMAMPGEFTRRSFINGKTSLTEAEALGDLLEAATDDQVSIARSGMRGNLSSKATEIYDSLCNVLAAIYAHIDYPDEDLADISRDEMLEVCEKNLLQLKALADTYKTGHAVVEGVSTVIVGRTNAGKSTLYNKIVGRDAAIVTAIEGTTRDVLTEKAALGKVTLRLSDTAGLRDSLDTVEKIGIDRARREAQNAELILAVFDASRETDSEDTEFVRYLDTLSGIKIAIINKTDKGIHPSIIKQTEGFAHKVLMSADSGEGLDALRDAVESVYIDNELSMCDSAIIANARQNAAVSSAYEALLIATEAIRNALPLEVCCVEVENALSALGELDGRTVTEDIISRIFANFCVGK
ncbi:MAG: tRNA uridine-5-carboxymethylaminomethyl(34) synthesis GTPase MnmE [Clostridia bacterium]|nr:tRNA uridine-5-carboxymethylaminomethyl(34) synthesis GTPase MnmE [Clostridia bacterium]